MEGQAHLGGSQQTRYPFERTSRFSKSLDGLGNRDRQIVLAKLLRFEREWMSDVPSNELNSTWDLKLVRSDQRCRRFKVMQLRITSDPRVFVTVVDPHRRVYYLDVHRKAGGGAQSDAIRRACDFASRIWEETDGSYEHRRANL